MELKSVLNPFASDENGTVFHAEDFRISVGWRFYCITCGERMIHKRSKLNNRFFAHKNKLECQGSYETELHRYAKQIISQNLKIKIPEYYVNNFYTQSYDIQSFDKGEIEPTGFLETNSFKPDVILVNGDSELLIEVLVTHEVDLEKEKKVDLSGESMIEIDLSEVRSLNLSKIDLDDYILNKSPRSWINHKNKKKLIERAAAQRLNEMISSNNEIRKYVESFIPSRMQLSEYSRTQRKLKNYGLDRAIGLPCSMPYWFHLETNHWQTLYLDKIFFDQDQRSSIHEDRVLTLYAFDHGEGSKPDFDSKYVGWLNNSSLRMLFNWDLIDAIRSHRERFGLPPEIRGHPNAALIEYQNLVHKIGGIFERSHGGRFETNKKIVGEIRRNSQLFSLLYSIVQSADDEWKKSFIKNWVRKEVDGYGDTPLRLAKEGGTYWDHLANSLVEICNLRKGGRPVSDLLGLPIFRANEVAAGRSVDHLRSGDGLNCH